LSAFITVYFVIIRNDPVLVLEKALLSENSDYIIIKKKKNGSNFQLGQRTYFGRLSLLRVIDL